MIDVAVSRKSTDSPTGWAAYVAAYKLKYPENADNIDYQALMKQYIGGKPV